MSFSWRHLCDRVVCAKGLWLAGPKRPRSADVQRRLTLECLEERNVPSILFHPGVGEQAFDLGGPVINNVHPYLVFWGNGWNTGSGPSMRNNLISAVNSMATGPFVSRLSEYRNSIGVGSQSAWVTDTDSSPGATFSPAEPGALLDLGFLDGHIPDPFYHADVNRLYIVIPQPGSVINNAVGDIDGYHAGQFYFVPPFFFPVPYVFATVSNDGSLDDVTTTLSHELVEAISDPTLMAIWVKPGSAANNEIADNEAAYYNYRFDGVNLVQSWFSRSDDAFIVPTNQRQNFFVTDGVLSVNGDQLPNKNDSISVTVSSSGGVQITQNGETAQFEPFTISSVIINTGSGNDSVSIGSTPVGVPITINLGNGADTVNVGDSLNRLVHHDVVTVNGQNGTATLNVNDRGTQSSETYTVTGNIVSRTSGGVGEIHYSHIQNLNVNVGTATETIHVQSTSAGTTTLIKSGTGADDVTVGGALNAGPLTVDGSGGSMRLFVIDGRTFLPPGVPGSYGFPGSYNVTSHTVQAAGAAPITYQALASVSLTTGLELFGVPLTVGVEGTESGTATTVTTQPGVAPNFVFVDASGKTLDNIRGPLNLDGANFSQLVVTDTGTSADETYTLTQDTISRTGAAAITYHNFPLLLALSGGRGHNSFYVSSTAAAIPVALDSAGQHNDFYLGNAANTVDDFHSPLTIKGQQTSNINLYDQGSNTGHTYVLTAATLTRDGHSLLSFSDSSLTVFAGRGNDLFTVVRAPAALPVSFHGGSGSNLLMGPDRDSIWLVGGANSGVLQDPGGDANVEFTDVQNIRAGSADDSFSFSPGASISGLVDGGRGTNEINLRTLSTPQIFTIDALNSGTVAGVTRFSSIQNLLGSSGDDQFKLLNGASVSGTIFGGGGNNTLDLSAFTTGLTFTIASANAGNIPGVTTFTSVQNLIGGSGDDQFVFSAGARLDGLADGRGGNNTLDLRAATAGQTFNIMGSNAGNIVGVASFTSVQSLIGGSGDDQFVFADAAGMDGTIDGQGGTNSLDDSAYTGNVLVDLQIAKATGVGGGIANIQKVIGGAGSNILVGNGGNVLTGGTGHNLLIAGASPSTLIGGAADNILIGGTTAYDMDLAALEAVMDYWAGPDDYSTRVANLLVGNGVPLLDATTVTSNGGGNTLAGGPGLDLFYGNLATDAVLNWDAATETFVSI
jgi:hypothetical protein